MFVFANVREFVSLRADEISHPLCGFEMTGEVIFKKNFVTSCLRGDKKLSPWKQSFLSYI